MIRRFLILVLMAFSLNLHSQQVVEPEMPEIQRTTTGRGRFAPGVIAAIILGGGLFAAIFHPSSIHSVHTTSTQAHGG